MRPGNNGSFAAGIQSRSPGIPNSPSDSFKPWLHPQIEALEARHKQLERKYEELLQKAQKRRLQHQALKGEIKAYSKLRSKDKEEIKRLQTLIENGKLQLREEKLVEADWLSRYSRINKFDQSTEDQIKVKNSAEHPSPKQKRPSHLKTYNKPQQMLEKPPQRGIFSRMKREVKQSQNFRVPKGEFFNSYFGPRYS